MATWPPVHWQSRPSRSPAHRTARRTAPTYPATVNFASGVGTASITLVDAQSTTLTATQGTITGTSGSFTVALATTTTFTVTELSQPNRRDGV